jgi:hypothetical protein
MGVNERGNGAKAYQWIRSSSFQETSTLVKYLMVMGLYIQLVHVCSFPQDDARPPS